MIVTSSCYRQTNFAQALEIGEESKSQGQVVLALTLTLTLTLTLGKSQAQEACIVRDRLGSPDPLLD